MRSQSACLYQKLMCSFSIPFSLSYSYVMYSVYIYYLPKLCTASSGKISHFPNSYHRKFHIILNLVSIILTSSTMAETGSRLMEVLKGKPQSEAAKIASSSYFSNKSSYRYYAMATLFSYFPTDEWRRISF